MHPLISKIDQMLTAYNRNQLQQNQQSMQSFPKQLIQFLQQKQIQTKQLIYQIPRYIRIKPKIAIQYPQLIKQLSINQDQIIIIDSQFYAIDPHIKIHHCKFYQQSSIYGMDYSSCIPIRCLNVQQNMKVLQLCSAPGNKSMYLADSLQNVSIVGVQINSNRANIMKNLINKYHLSNKISVTICDGLTFTSQQLFGRVLIDVQCTHQGSIKHIKKFIKTQQKNKHQNKKDIKNNKILIKQQQKQYKINNSNPYISQKNKSNQWSIADFKQRFLDQKKLNNLSQLQYGLLSNGFKLLKQNGILVYCTCSFDYSQNQGIITKFINNMKNAELMDCRDGLNCALPYKNGSSAHLQVDAGECLSLKFEKCNPRKSDKSSSQLIFQELQKQLIYLLNQ